MVEPLRHRQTKEAATDMLDLKSPRHTSTLPKNEPAYAGARCARGLHVGPVFDHADIHARDGDR